VSGVAEMSPLRAVVSLSIEAVVSLLRAETCCGSGVPVMSLMRGTNLLISLVKSMLCSKFRCQKVLIKIPFHTRFGWWCWQEVSPEMFNLVRPVWKQASKSPKKAFVETSLLDGAWSALT